MSEFIYCTVMAELLNYTEKRHAADPLFPQRKYHFCQSLFTELSSQVKSIYSHCANVIHSIY